MIFAKSHIDLHNIRNNVERVKKLSDNIVGVGPLGIGLDGLLTWIPGAGELYSLGAGGLIVWDAVRARAAPMIVVQIIAIIVIDTVSGALPGAGKIVDVLFTGHKWSADMLTKHMDDTIYFEGARKDMQGSQEYRELLSRIQAGKEKRRVVFLG
ncbi:MULTISPECIES: DUF4112 domain-containing protein [Caulobacter]|uniref:DUF4112 domain-containing protein n=1 Tax=Caulobacter vibrioides OR37 TaxID=1292034 RepID=R0D086_CAUVI|nr:MULTISPECIES: DUF4112 domain-containing protein [Caulobacter]ENZ81910.1 hypothetical protein OR37_02145 [Caulobacter vibrioides OR37]MBQ1559575.1 DUF4112 domain-containing protein [Caulobacter sp.]